MLQFAGLISSRLLTHALLTTSQSFVMVVPLTIPALLLQLDSMWNSTVNPLRLRLWRKGLLQLTQRVVAPCRRGRLSQRQWRLPPWFRICTLPECTCFANLWFVRLFGAFETFPETKLKVGSSLLPTKI